MEPLGADRAAVAAEAKAQQKLSGKPIRIPTPRKAPKVVDLMKALQESLRARGAAPKRGKVRRAA